MDCSPITGLSLFSGIAGLDLGVGLALGDCYRSVGYVERDAYASAVLLARMEGKALEPAPIWCGDVGSFDARPFRGVDVLTAGYPCQPFSYAGRRGGENDERHLWPEVARVIREAEPAWCFFENVRGHVTLGLEVVIGELESLGYRSRWGVFSADECGAPHRRERVFILAHRRCDGGAGRRRPIDVARSPRASKENREQRERDGDSACDGCEAMAHRDGAGSQGHGQPGERSGERATGTGGGELGDAERADAGAGVEGVETGEGFRRCGSSDASRVFPPGPGDAEGWRRFLELHPAAEPAICRDADGHPGSVDRSDRLRCLGNGVVPLQAAYAFVTLYAAIKSGNI